MELTYLDLRRKEVINIGDGRRLGRVTDIVFTVPKNVLTGIVVPGCGRGGLFKSSPDLFIAMGCIVKIGEDVILVDLKNTGGTGIKQGGDSCSLYNAGSFDENE